MALYGSTSSDPNARRTGVDHRAADPDLHVRSVPGTNVIRVSRRILTLIVDDEDDIRAILRRIMESAGHRCVEAANAEEARDRFAEHGFDLVLCDVNMPGESGPTLVRHILDRHTDTAVVMVTGTDDPEVATLAIEAGAYGYVVKPFTPNEILINVNGALHRRRLERENRMQRAELAATVRERTEDLSRALVTVETTDARLHGSVVEMMRRLSLATELRDPETANHIDRMSRYAELLGRAMGWSADRCMDLKLASRLHDAGKISVPDRVLRKAGLFTDAEFAVMKTHAEIGYQLFEGSDAPLLEMASMVAWTHHERWDGAGYPRGISGQSIPIEGRIAAIADVFDALSSRRSYKVAYAPEQVVEIMKEQRGKHFDGDLLDVFLENLDAAFDIQARFPDRT